MKTDAPKRKIFTDAVDMLSPVEQSIIDTTADLSNSFEKILKLHHRQKLRIYRNDYFICCCKSIDCKRP